MAAAVTGALGWSAQRSREHRAGQWAAHRTESLAAGPWQRAPRSTPIRPIAGLDHARCQSSGVQGWPDPAREDPVLRAVRPARRWRRRPGSAAPRGHEAVRPPSRRVGTSQL